MAAKHNTDRLRAKRAGSLRADPRLDVESVERVAENPVEGPRSDVLSARAINEAVGTQADEREAAAHADAATIEHAADSGGAAVAQTSLGEFGRGLFGGSDVVQLAQAGGGAVADTSASAPAAAGGFSPGLGTLFGLLGAAGLAGSGSGGGGLAGGASAGAAPKPLVTASIEVINGYVAGAKVWQDTNNNGKIDAGEPIGWWDKNGNGKLDAGEQETSAEGRITLQLDPQGGPVRTLGGTDLSTGKPVTNSFAAPARGTVISPITTVIQAAIASGESLTDAVNTVKRAFGLDAGADLLTLDPVESSLGTGAASDQAIKVKAAAVQISNAMDLGASLLAGAGSGADNSALVAASLAKAIMSGGGASVNLASANTLSSVLTDAVSASGLSGTARDKAQGALATTAFLAANANAIVAEAVNAPDHKEALTVIGRAQRVAQVEASEALSAAIQSGGAMATVASGFSGSAFATKASQITDGVIAPGVSMVSVDVLPTTVAAPTGSGITVEATPLRASITPIGSTALAGLTAGGSGKFSVSFSSAPTAFDASKIEIGAGLTIGGIEKLTNTRYVVTVNAGAGQIGERTVKLAAGWAGQGSTGDEVTVKVNPPFAGMQFSESSARVLGFEGASADIVKLSDGNSVMRFTKPLTAKPYAGATLALNVADALGTIDVSASDSKLGMWVYAPQANLPIRLQLASSDAGLVPRYTQAGQPLISDDRKFVETETRTIKAGWQWMEFDFGKPVDRWVGVYETAIKVALDPAVRYDKVSVFPDFNATPTGATFYFDGLTRGGTAPGVPVEPPGKFSSLDFQGAAASYRQLGFGGASGSLVADPENADNTVVKVVKSANAETWAGVTLTSLPGDAAAVPSIPFSAGTVMTAAVYSPAAGTKVRMKVENSADPTVSVETESVTKYAGWETVRFDFANPVNGTAPLDAAKTYDKLNVFFDFGVAGSNGRSYYIDDIRFLGAAARAPGNPIPAGYSLVFEDAFDVAGKTAPNPAVWKYDLGDGSKKNIPGWGNGEQQYYTADPDNVWVENGSLHIVAKANDTATNTADRIVNGAVVPFTSGITSARLTTQGWNVSPYGYVEVRAKLPAEQGAWPAIWMLGSQNNWPKSGEIDIVEWSGRYFNDSTAQAALHFEKDFGNTQTKASTSLSSSVERFHTYQLWWSPTEIRIGVDGDAESAYFRYTKQADFDVSRWPFDAPFYLLMNVAVGGTLGGDGFAQALAQAPYEMQVDYVRVYQGASSGGSSGSSNALLVSFETSDTSGYAVGTGADFGGAASSVVSDGPAGSNGRVAKVVKGQGAETWAGTTLLALSGKEVISAGNETVTMKVYAPAAGIPVMLKVENGANSSQFIEKTVNTTQAGAWETLSFNFAGANHTPDYTKASVFFDFGTGGTGKTFYLDDVSLGGAAPSATYTAPSNLKVSFETSDTSGYTLGTGADFGGAASSLVSDGPAGSSGKVAKVVKGQGAETWAGTTFLALSGKEVIASGAETVTLRVQSPQAGTAVMLKLENGANGSQFVEKQMT
ncbi:MAG: glycoside hydrolase family 16 protein, partial [Betaproteobacteria bacterium]|nr:glycoside hydrolase family 16 protein [Betaproteobacteria bacterium]